MDTCKTGVEHLTGQVKYDLCRLIMIARAWPWGELKMSIQGLINLIHKKVVIAVDLQNFLVEHSVIDR